MRPRFRPYTLNSALVATAIAFVMWLIRYLPIIRGDFKPDMSNPLDVILLHSSPGGDFVGTLITSLICLTPIVSLFGTAFAGLFLRNEKTKLSDASADTNIANRNRNVFAPIALILFFAVGVGVWSASPFDRVFRSDFFSDSSLGNTAAGGTASSSSTPDPVSTPTPIPNKKLILENDDLRLEYQATWSLVQIDDGFIWLSDSDT